MTRRPTGQIDRGNTRRPFVFILTGLIWSKRPVASGQNDRRNVIPMNVIHLNDLSLPPCWLYLVIFLVNAIFLRSTVVLRNSNGAAAQIDRLDGAPAACDPANVGRHSALQARDRRGFVTDIRMIRLRVRAVCARSVHEVRRGGATVTIGRIVRHVVGGMPRRATTKGVS